MSNETTHDTHDTHEPTGARLTDDDVRFLAARAQFYLDEYKSDTTDTNPLSNLSAVRMLATDVVALTTDRARQDERIAALEAENARLQAEMADAKRTIGILTIHKNEAATWEEHLRQKAIAAERERDAANAQNADMRPLVEALARHEAFSEFYVDFTGDTCCHGCRASASTHIDFPHDDNCLVLAARALVAQWPTAAAPETTQKTTDEHTNGEHDR